MNWTLPLTIFSLLFLSCSSLRTTAPTVTEKREPAQIVPTALIGQVLSHLPFQVHENCLEQIRMDVGPVLLVRGDDSWPRVGAILRDEGISNADDSSHFLIRRSCVAEWNRRVRSYFLARHPVSLIEFHASTPRAFCGIAAVPLACEVSIPSQESGFYRLEGSPLSLELQTIRARAGAPVGNFDYQPFQRTVFFVQEGRALTRSSSSQLFLLGAYDKSDAEHQNQVREIRLLSYALRIPDSAFPVPTPSPAATSRTIAEEVVQVASRLYSRPYPPPDGPVRLAAWLNGRRGRQGEDDPVLQFVNGLNRRAALLREQWALRRSDPVHSRLFSQNAVQVNPLDAFPNHFLSRNGSAWIESRIDSDEWRDEQNWLRGYGDEVLAEMARVLSTSEDPERLLDAASYWWSARSLLLALGCGRPSAFLSPGNRQEIVHTQYRHQNCRRLYAERFVQRLSGRIEATRTFRLDDSSIFPVLAMSSRKERVDLFMRFLDLLRQRLRDGPELSPVERNILAYEAVQVNSEIRADRVLTWTGLERADDEDRRKLTLLLSRFREFFVSRPASRDADFRLAALWLSGIFGPSPPR